MIEHTNKLRLLHYMMLANRFQGVPDRTNTDRQTEITTLYVY